MLFLAVYNCYCILCWWKLVYTFYSIVGKFKNVKQKVLAQFALNEKPQKYSLEVIVKSQTSDPYVKLFRRYWDTIILFIFCNSFKKKCWFWKLVGLASMYRNRLLFVGTGIGPGWKGCTPGRCPSLLDSGTRESLLFVLPGFAPSTPRYSFSLSLLFERQRHGRGWEFLVYWAIPHIMPATLGMDRLNSRTWNPVKVSQFCSNNPSTWTNNLLPA